MLMKLKNSLSLMVVLLMLVFVGSSALAAPPEGRGNNKPKPGDGGTGGNTSEPYGLDVSWPQCGKRLPTDMAFAIVGVNDGLANTTNPCLADQLVWASQAPGTDNQPGLQLYVNTANPAKLNTPSWPTGNIDSDGDAITSIYGTCSGVFNYDLACSYQYGWNRAVEDNIERFTPAATIAGVVNNPANYTWWLDAEIMNSWLPPTSEDNFKSNVAVLEGMADYFLSIGANIGVYSNSYQWGEITGGLIRVDSSLTGLPDWRPSGDLATAKYNCTAATPLTAGGYVAMTQYIKKNLDHNYSCRG